MNYFEYQDYPKIDRSQVVITTDLELQTGSSIEQLKEGVKPYDYASFEKDAYITDKPKELAPSNALLGLVSKEISNKNGWFIEEGYFPYIEIDLNGAYLFTGITIGLINEIDYIDVTVIYSDGGKNTRAFFPYLLSKSNLKYLSIEGMASKGIVKVKIRFRQTVLPYRFLGVYRIELGRTVIFDATNLVDANVVTHYDVDGSTIQYDVAELTIFTGENDSEYLFQKKQPIVYKDADGKTLHKFYVENGENNDDATASLTAYDSVSLLEDEYLGGIYGFTVKEPTGTLLEIVAPTITFENLVNDILKGTEVEYEISESIKDIELSGYIPICTRRKALVLILKGTNTRIVKREGKLLFKPINEAESVVYGKSNVGENPNISKSSKIGKLTVLEHKYQKDTEPIDLYNWYLKQGDNTMQLIKFDEPVYKVLAYEVTGTDENGFDIINPVSSTNITFYHAPISGGSEDGDENVCNHCIIKSCNTSNRVVLKGRKIIDDTNDNIYYQRTDIDNNADYEDIVIEDVTITAIDSGVKEVAKTLFAIESQRQTEDFVVVEVDRPNVGDNVSTPMIESPVSFGAYDKDGNRVGIDYNVKIVETEDNLSGVYRVVAK